ncbi:hypothetical protein PGB90_000052 [Kerria lacca]
MAEVQTDYYEEMFKEITKKFYYGDDDDDLETTNMSKNEDLLTSNKFKVDEENQNTTFNDDLSSIPNEYESSIDVSDAQVPKFTFEEENWICSDDTIPWTASKIASYSATQKLFRCNECECIGFLSRIAEHWLGSHANLRVFQCSQCPYASAWARCVKMHLARQHHDICPEPTSDENFQKLMKVNPVLEEVTKYLEKLKSKLESNEETETEDTKTEPDKEFVENNSRILETNNIPTEMYALSSIKRYNCEHCSYATDRKDLFTRHENIHREDKPFQCNVCQKQFNRADHIKKHFIRMHRDHEYVLSNVRRAKTQNRSNSDPYKSKEKTVVISTSTTLSQETTETALQAIIQRQIPTTITTQDTASQIIQDTHQSVIQSTHMQEFLQQTDAEQMDISFFGTHTLLLSTDVKPPKPKQRMKKYNIEKNVQCSYCTWTGADNWCLKRHLNTHLKPYICSMCEYKAARSERLTTHIFRVHNKRACTKCSFLADDLTQLTAHQLENHK